MSTISAELLEKHAKLERKRRQARAGDIRACGWLQTKFPESFGSGNKWLDDPAVGLDGHLWIMIPITEDAAATAAKGAGIQKTIQEIIPDADPGKWQLHASFRKYSRGFFKPSVWICGVLLLANRKQIVLGSIAATNLRQFATDLRQMTEIGYPTFGSAIDAFEAVP